MRILIDGDGCPVVSEAVHIANTYHLECLILCDTAHELQRPGATTIVVSQGSDSVDYALVNLVERGDIVVTQDYGLAAMALARRAYPIRQDGLVYDEYNIGALLAARHTAKKIRRGGGRLRGPKKRSEAENTEFISGLKQLIESHLP